jgi:rabenosyn-5
MDAFTQYDIASRRVRDMPTDSPTQQKLQKAIYQQASQFLHLHMLPLKTLPKILKHATPNGDRINSTLANGNTNKTLHPRGALASIHYHNRSFDSTSQLSTTSSQISALEAEEKTLRERLIVLEEQKFMVSEMLAAANKRRKFDEVAALQGNVEDLSREIDGVQNQIAGLDFEGVYASQNGFGLGLGEGVVTPPVVMVKTKEKEKEKGRGLPNG